MAKKHSRNIWKWRIISGSDQSLCSFVCAGVCMEFHWIMCLYIRPALTWCVCVCVYYESVFDLLRKRCNTLSFIKDFSSTWLRVSSRTSGWDSENGSETVQLLQDGRETAGKEATNGRLRVASPSTGPARTADINFPMRAGKAGRKHSDLSFLVH